MNWVLIFVFVIGYIFILLERSSRIDKAAISVCMMLTLSIIVSMGLHYNSGNESNSLAYLMEIHEFEHMFYDAVFHAAGIAFFLLSSMCIVEIMDSYSCFHIMSNTLSCMSGTNFVTSTALCSFCMSSLLDNMTSCIVMSVLINKLIDDKFVRNMILSLILLSVNIGGAWSPIGDVTTTMLWIKGAVTVKGLIFNTFLPCLVAQFTAIGGVLAWLYWHGKSVKINKVKLVVDRHTQGVIVGIVGILSLLSAPVLHSLLRIPPFIGVMGGFGILWTVIDILGFEKGEDQSVIKRVLAKVDIASVLFFYGIVVSISILQYAGILYSLANTLISFFHSIYEINIVIGLVSAIIDNVPLVAAISSMFDLATYPTDSFLWYGLAYCAGVGGNLMILGSAAGVALMGLAPSLDVIWYLRNVTLIATASYFAGVLVMCITSYLF